MSKKLMTKSLFGQQALLALAFTASLAAAGCTTDRHLGNGDPVVTPGLRTSPTAVPSIGSETAPARTMYSSSSRFADTSIVNGTLPASSPAGAAAIMTQHLPAVRVLGVGVDGPAVPGAENLSTDQFQNPAMIANPRQTINSSISSPGTPAVGVALGDVAAGNAIGGTLGTGAGVSSGVSIAGTPAGIAATSVTPGLAPSPLAAATPASVGAFAGTSLSPTAVSSVNPPASVSGLTPTVSPTAVSASNVSVAGAATVSPTASSATPIATSATSTTTAAPRATAIRGARVTNAGGRVVVTPAVNAKSGTSQN